MLLPIKSHHVHIRWHKVYAACFRRQGCEQFTQSILDDPRCRYDNRLLIDENDWKVVLQTASQIEVERGTDDPLFDKSYIFIQRNKSGVIHHSLSRDGSDSRLELANSMYNAGNLSQESYHGDVDINANNGIAEEGPMITGANKFVDRRSILENISNLMEGNGFVEDYFDHKYASLVAHCRNMLFENSRLDKDERKTEFVGVAPQVDANNRYKQKIGVWEENNRKRKHKKTEESICYSSYFME